MGFTQIIFEEDWKPRRLYIVDLGDSPAKGTKDNIVKVEGSVQDAHWSPAGDRLVVSVTPRQLVDDTLMFKRIRIISPDGRVLGRIENPGKLGQIAWSTDGERLAFIATDTVSDTREGRLMVASKNGGQFRNILPNLEGHIWHVGCRDANTVLFISHEGVNARIATIRHDGTNQQTLVAAGGPIWETFSVPKTGDIVATANAPRTAGEVFRLRGAQHTPTRLTDSNPWLAEVPRPPGGRDLPARDGLDIEGVLFYPLDYKPGQKYPLVLAVHGGPEAHFSNGWLTRYNLPPHHLSAEGYFTFYQNYAARPARREVHRDQPGPPAKEEFDDLVDGVDYLVEKGLVDKDRVGITGGSYGGYATAWRDLLQRPLRRRRHERRPLRQDLHARNLRHPAGTLPRPLHDLALGELGSLQGSEPHLPRAQRQDPDPDHARRRRPARRSHAVQDPLPLPRPAGQPAARPPRPLPGRGPRQQRAASRYDYSLRLMQWMNHYLKGEGGAMPDFRLDYGFDPKNN